MSKASEWSKKITSINKFKPKPFKTKNINKENKVVEIGKVDPTGSLTLQTARIFSDDALALGKWLIDTFGEGDASKD